ncbi:Uncharacterized protein APZ42_003179, partial [Daphnia magna]
AGRHVVDPVAHQRDLARKGWQAAGDEVAEGLAARVEVATVAVDEVHRHIEHPVDIPLEAEPLLENERQDAAAIGVCIGPDVAAEAAEAVGLALGEGRVGEERGRDRLQGQGHAELLHHVRFGRIVQVHLHGTGTQHHVEAERAALGHILAHDLVAALGHPGDVGACPFRVEAQPQHAGAELLA